MQVHESLSFKIWFKSIKEIGILRPKYVNNEWAKIRNKGPYLKGKPEKSAISYTSGHNSIYLSMYLKELQSHWNLYYLFLHPLLLHSWRWYLHLPRFSGSKTNTSHDNSKKKNIQRKYDIARFYFFILLL